MVVNTIVDLLYPLIDPRVRARRAEGLRMSTLPSSARRRFAARGPRDRRARCYLALRGLVGLVVLVALLAPWIAPARPQRRATCRRAGRAVRRPPARHRLAPAATRSPGCSSAPAPRCSARLASWSFSTVAGVAVGVAAAWRGGWLDSLLAAQPGLSFAFPGLLLAILSSRCSARA